MLLSLAVGKFTIHIGEFVVCLSVFLFKQSCIFLCHVEMSLVYQSDGNHNTLSLVKINVRF